MQTKKQTTAVLDKPSYPPAKIDEVKENLQGQVVVDPYRWLEDDNSEEVKRWTEEQNKLTMSYLEKLPYREKIKNRLTELWNYPKMSSPEKYGKYYFFTKNDGLQNQAILYVQKGLQGKAKAVIDPNTLSEEGIISLDYWFPNQDGSLVAYGLSHKGDEKSILYVKNALTEEDFPEEIEGCGYLSLVWALDSKGFYYRRYVKDSVIQQVFYHTLGTDPNLDTKLFEAENDKIGIGLELSSDGRYLVIGSKFFFNHELHFIDLWENKKITPVITGFKHVYKFLLAGDKLFILTNENAPFFKIITIPLQTPQPKNWKTAVPEQKYLLKELNIINRKLVLHYIYKAHSRLKTYTLSGKLLNEIKLPAMGLVQNISGQPNSKEMFFTFSSFTYPPVVYRYNFAKNELRPFYKTPVKIKTSDYQLKQVWYKSKDGTKVSMFIIAKKGLKLDSKNPTYLVGYGGFNYSFTPDFSAEYYPWLEGGGIVAVPNIRGGGEYGDLWYKTGILDKKQNSFDDFIEAAKWLISENYTNKEKLAIYGVSNGGLLVGAVMTQNPELFKAVIYDLPLADMLRYHKFSTGRFFVPEYGSPEDPEYFKYLYAYSPYHNVKDNAFYPASFIITADSDTRVAPLHGRKMTARLQKASSSGKPSLLLTEENAGHGIGRPLNKSIERSANIWSFIFWQLNVPY